MRSLEGSKVHEQMMQLAKQHLEQQGYETVLRVRLNSGGILDVLGIKGKERIGIECQIVPSKAIIEQKKKNYGPYLNRLIVAFPQNAKHASLPSDIELLALPVDKPKPKGVRVQFMISEEVERRFREAIFRTKGMKKGNISQALEEAIKCWIEQAEAKKPSL